MSQVPDRAARTRGLLIAWLAAAAGCSTYAPPVRGALAGAPGRLTEGQVEIGGVAAGVYLPEIGGPHVGVAVRDWLAIEAGANLQAANDPGNRWAMGFVGPRFSFVPQRESDIHFVSDFELGFGAGAGGALDDNRAINPACVSGCGDGLTGWQRFAFGSYQGIGVGGRFHWFTLFLRARLEETTATNVPLTLWPSAMVAGEAQIGRHVALSFGGGAFALWNREERIVARFYQLALTLFFEGWKRRPAPGDPPPR